MNSKVVILAGGNSGAVPALAEAVKGLGETVAVVVGTMDEVKAAAASNVSKVIALTVDPSVPAEAAVSEVVAVVKELSPALVLASGDHVDRVLLGGVAGATGSPALGGVKTVEASGDSLLITRTMYGSVTERTEQATAMVCCIMDATGAAEVAVEAPVEERPVQSPNSLRIESTTPPAEKITDLGSAKRVVDVGRGLKAKEDLSIITAFAEALDAEVGCSRPVAEGLGWMPKTSYLGISGKRVAPKLCVATGVSGPLQHMVGIRDSDVIVAINTDDKAPIFKECDYGIVGDLYQIIPELTKALKG